MSNSTEVTSLITYDIVLNGRSIPSDYLVISISLLKEVNKISYAKVMLLDGQIGGDGFELSDSGDFKIGNKIEIKVGYSTKNKSVFKGIITKQAIKINASASNLIIECHDEAMKMTTGKNNAIFQKKNDSDIISEIIRKQDLQSSVDATKVMHPEVVQHHCSDWDFIMMRAEINGLIVLTEDGSIKIEKPKLDASADVELKYGENIISISAEIDASNQYSTVNSVAWDMANQKIVKSSSKSPQNIGLGKTTTKELSTVLGSGEYNLQTSANLPMDALEAWADAKLLKSTLSKIQGKVEFQGSPEVKAGGMIKLSGLSKSFNGNAFVGAVEHIIEEGTWKTIAHLGLSFNWYAEDTPNVEASSAGGMLAAFKGLTTAIVKKIHEDSDGQTRVQVAFPTLEKDNLAVWARLSNLYATNGSGTFFMPEIGDEVVVGFLNEDPQFPIILGMLYSSKQKPPFEPDEKNKTKAIVTKSKLTISFDDEDKIIEITTPGKNSIKFDDKGKQILIQDENKNVITLSKDGIKMETEKDFVIKSKGKITMEATSDISIKSNGDIKGEGMNVELNGKTKVTAKGTQAEVNGSAQTVIKGGMVMIN